MPADEEPDPVVPFRFAVPGVDAALVRRSITTRVSCLIEASNARRRAGRSKGGFGAMVMGWAWMRQNA